MNHRGESKGESKEESKGENKKSGERPDATSSSKLSVGDVYGWCRLLRLKRRVLRLAILLVGLIVTCVLMSAVLGPGAGSGRQTAATLQQTADRKIQEPWAQSKGDGELYFPSIKRRTSPARISVSVLTSKKTFHRVQQHAAEWARAGCYTLVTRLLHCCYTVVTLLLHSCDTLVTLLLHRYHPVVTLMFHCCLHCCHTAGVRLSVWIDELPAVVSPELKPITYESTAKRQAWWQRTKQVCFSRHALLLLCMTCFSQKNYFLNLNGLFCNIRRITARVWHGSSNIEAVTC
jgi:hypothetical protein